jgi:hypothetical protein
MKTRFAHLLSVVLASVLFAGAANASMIFSFDNITNNNAGDAAIGVAQLFVEVSDIGGGQVLFTFFNRGPEASSITDTYFDADGSSLLSLAGLIDADDGIGGNAGVDFSVGASPPNLPGANNASPPFVTTVGFLADPDPPVQANGVNPGESLGIIFDLAGIMTFADVLSEIADGTIRMGIHVQGFDSGGSESFVNNPPNPVPIPAAVWLFGSALIGLIGISRRRAKLTKNVA